MDEAPGETLDRLSGALVGYLTNAFIGRAPVAAPVMQVVPAFFTDPLQAREFCRMLEAASDTIVAHLRAAAQAEGLPAAALADLAELVAAQDPFVPMPTEWLRDDGPTRRLRNELGHLVNDLAAGPPPLDAEFPTESLRHVRSHLAEHAESLELVHQFHQQSRSLLADPVATEADLEKLTQYRLNLTQEVDVVELFGADIDPAARRSALHETFIPLRMTTATSEDGVRTFSEVLDQAAGWTSRVLIRGTAGSGKTTLLRWAALTAAQHGIAGYHQTLRERHARAESIFDSGEEFSAQETREFDDRLAQWQTRIPFLLYLRHLDDAALPAPEDLPAVLAHGPGAPDAEWAHAHLARGRALLLIDGIDEVPVLQRDALRGRLARLLAAYPKNLVVVTTRPEAVPTGWLQILDFAEARVAPMSTHDTTRLIYSWHDAMKRELMRAGKPARHLDRLAVELDEKVRTDASLTPLSTTPLLCSMLCALHHYRSRSMPTSLRALCEELSKMLLDRRDRDSGLDPALTGPEWAGMSYERRRLLVRRFAHHMVDQELSSITMSAAEELVREGMTQAPDQDPANARAVLHSLVERSGMLREARPATETEDGVLDFLHNTFKEFLAGEAIAENGRPEVLIERWATNADWQRVALFAVSAGSVGFTSAFLSSVLTSCRSLPTDERRGAELFCLQCRAAAQGVDEALRDFLDVLLTEVFPPRTLDDGERIAAIGAMAVSYLRPRETASPEEAAACVRALRLINTVDARQVLELYKADDRRAVVQELVAWANPLTVPAIAAIIVRGDRLPAWIQGQLTDLAPLADISGLSKLDLRGTGIESLATLPELPDLVELDISETRVASLDALARVPGLTTLNADDVPLTDLDHIGRLQHLQHLSVRRTAISSIWPLRAATTLRRLDISWTPATSLTPLSDLVGLETLVAQGLQVGNVNGLQRLQALTSLDISESRVTDLGSLPLTPGALEVLDLRGTPIRDLRPLARAARLRTLDLTDTRVAQLDPLAGLPSLADLSIDHSTWDMVWPLRRNTGLTLNRTPHETWSERFERNLIFISYSHAQRAIMAELRTMLEPVVGTRLVGRLWTDEGLHPGGRWREDIVRQLHSTRVAVLLVSKEFLASDFIREVELSYFLERAEQDEVALLWVPVNHALYEHSPLSAIQAVLPPDRPLMADRGAARELALKRVAEAIHAAYTDGSRFTARPSPDDEDAAPSAAEASPRR